MLSDVPWFFLGVTKNINQSVNGQPILGAKFDLPATGNTVPDIGCYSICGLATHEKWPDVYVYPDITRKFAIVPIGSFGMCDDISDKLNQFYAHIKSGITAYNDIVAGRYRG